MTEFPAPWYQPGGEPDPREGFISPEDVLKYGKGFLDVQAMKTNDRSVNHEPAGSQEPIEGRCNAFGRQRQAPCRKPAGWGTDHVGTGACRLHGGNMGNHQKAAQKAKAKAAVRTLGLPVEIDPADALLQEVWRSQGHVIWYGEVIAQLRKGDLGWGITKEKRGGEDWGTTHEAKINIYLALYNEERKHLARVSSEAIKAGVEAKRLSLETHRAELMVGMLGSIFDGLDLTPEQLTKLDELVPKALTTIAVTEATK